MTTNQNTIKLYWDQIKKHKVSFFVGLTVIPIAGLLLDTLVPFFFSLAIGGLTRHNEHTVYAMLIAAAAAGVLGVTCNLVGYQFLLRHEATVRVELSGSIFQKLLAKDLSFFVNEKVGALTSHYIDFIRNHTVLQSLIIVRTLGFLLSVGTGVTIVAFHSLILGGILLLLLVGLAFQVRFSLKIRGPYRQRRKALIGEVHGKIADAITNNLIVKTFARESYEVDTVEKVNLEFKDAYIKDFRLTSIEGSTRIFLMTITQIIALSISASLVFSGHLELAIAIFILTYLQRINSQLFNLSDMINGYDQVLLEAAPMSDIMMRQNSVIDKPNAVTLRSAKPIITFDDMSYHYSDVTSDVLEDINLTIKPGQKVGLVGPSGAGKTTITHLLLRFADVTGGSIKIDGHDLRDITQDSLRKAIAYVPQEPMLFHRSLRENIAYGKLDATDTEIRRAAKQANALDFIEALPSGLDTLVGERGVKLSGGQRQRIAIARAILKNAPVLILDEATSALDSASEKLIQDALTKLMKNRTSIVIAHRLSTIAKLDRIIVLDDGKIIEDGTHAELLSQKGMYAKLWAHQSGGFIEE